MLIDHAGSLLAASIIQLPALQSDLSLKSTRIFLKYLLESFYLFDLANLTGLFCKGGYEGNLAYMLRFVFLGESQRTRRKPTETWKTLGLNWRSNPAPSF